MLKKIAIVVVVLIAALLAFAATKPDGFRVQRSASIKAPPEKIYPLISDLKRWSAWSPWEKLDPAMKRTHSGAASGKGAVYAWQGNREIGAGRMEIIEAAAPAKVAIRLDFLEPFEAQNFAEFTLRSQGEATNVTWAMYGPSPYVSKLMSVFFDMDAMIGAKFEAGLADLKAAAER
jgi:uncharacterized protein YndB with AHSA1/START domain